MHPAAPAVATCYGCLQPICDACVVMEDFEQRCAPCARAHRARKRRRSIAATLAAIVAVALVAGVGGWLWWTYEPSFDYGPRSREIARLTAQLEDEPCNRGKALDLVEGMVQAGDNRGALARSAAFFDACGDFTRLRWLTYEAHKRLSEWDLAADEATMLVASDPWDADFRWWRGLVYEQKGDDERAIADYRQAMALRPEIRSIPINLATLLERQGRPCEATAPIEQLLFYYPDAGNADALRQRADTLARAGGCRTEGRAARIRFDRGTGLIHTRARVNARAEGTFAIDTGASYVTLARRFAEETGIPTDGPQVWLATAAGPHTGTLATVDALDVQGLTASAVPVVVIDGLDPDLDGLLGLSFLARFDLVTSEDALEIRPR
ncbi:MAG: aspartyl protease family protein [Myxococcota bacterium]